ncbi:autotransporter outer membrane beta-barrel domain-containing protein [Pelistega suis]|uniref:autotransporter outer membrane beta-barrel domain-containing protein n=1 Tax=Pelistega suis TaxID=1631957 RepID=UPI00211BEAB7|nr:autotransporter outer membrane beta-barrel domain-containing protein [Pelistega suis]MCQ9328867.1 autotransporter outer membrane beta-barrel domain-containing protein [Pelistega suis]
MNKIYKVKWSAHTQSYVACSELTKSQGKANKVLVSAMLAGLACLGGVNTATAAECTFTGTQPNQTYNTSATCEITPQTITGTVGWQSKLLARDGANVSVTGGDLSLDLLADSPRNTVFASTGVSAQRNSSINVEGTLTVNLTGASNKRTEVFGVSAWANSSISADTINVKAIYTNEVIDGRATPTSHGIQVGSAVSGEDRVATGESKVTVRDANIEITNSKNTHNRASIWGFEGEYAPYQLSAIRVIRYEDKGGSKPVFESTGKVTINAYDSSDSKTGNYIIGLYVSGPDSLAKLNDSEITLGTSGQYSSALKIGKTRITGAGSGEVQSRGNMVLDTTAESRAVAVRLIGDNSLLKADYDTSSGEIKSASTAILFGSSDYSSGGAGNNQQALFRNTKITTTNDTRNALIQMNASTTGLFGLKGDESEAIASTQAYLVDVAARSNLQVDATDAGQMTGLTNKTDVSTLNLNLDNNFSWNLREHTAADASIAKTSTFNTTTLANGAVINAIKGDGTATFELKGDVVSKDGIIRLSDATTALVSNGQATAGDVLTITGNYTATNGTVLLDTKLGDDSSATDLLHITGNSTGTNTLKVTPVVDSLGAFTQQGIKVVWVDGTSDENTNYTLEGDGVISDDSLTIGAENKHQFTYRLYQGTRSHPGTGTDNGIPAGVDTAGIDANDWYLRSVCGNGSHSVGSAFITSTYDGLGCITDDTITVTTGADIAKVEGAGGADTILINSDAKVSGDVYGGNAGVDNSADKDGNDTITVTDNAVVSGTVYGQAGDDTIVWSGASTIAGLDGGNGSDVATVSSTQYNGTQILDGGDDVDVADGWIDTLNLNGVKVTANGGNIRNWETIALNNGTDLTLEGTLTAGKGKTPTGTQIGLQIDNSSILAISGTTATVSGDVSNAGTIDLTRDGHTPSQTLTIDGDYIGSAGSKVKMNTVWNKTGDANGANSQSDLLAITGSATGQTSVIPVSADGKDLVISGDVEQISTVINTIPVITVGKTGSERVFIGSAVTPSGIEAQLAKRTVNGVDQYFWTIDGVEVPVEPPVVPPVTPVDPVVPPVTPVDPVVPPVTPVDPVVPPVTPVDPVVPPVVPVVPSNPTYDPRVPGYVLMPRVNMEQGYATLRTLHERRGENQTLAWDNCGTCGEQANGQTWGRLIGSNLEVDGKHRLGFETKSYGFQFGHDFAINRTDEGGHRLTGAYISYNRANTTFKDEFSRENGELLADKTAGKGKSDAWSLGVTHTRYSPFGAYLDLVGQVSFYRNKYEPRKYNNVSQNGMGIVLSAEVGKPYAFSHRQPGEAGWMIEPQAQLIYQMVNLKDFNDGTRHVDQGVQHGLRGRIGARLAYNEQAEKDVYRTDTFYAVANIWHDFVKPSAVKLAGNKIREEHASTWAEVGIGMQLPIRKQTYIYGDARYERELGGTKREGYRGTVGLKYTWK